MSIQVECGCVHDTGRKRNTQRGAEALGGEIRHLLRALVLVAPLLGGLASISSAAIFFDTQITAHDAAAGDQFGFSVSESGKTVIVGSPFDDDAGASSGSVYVFERDTGGTDNWGELKKITAADAAAGDAFGFAVSISGDTVVVGAPFRDDVGLMSGAVYIFERDVGGGDGWGQVKKLVPSDTDAGDEFGFAVAISGNTLVVGAPSDDDAGSESGGAYVFERDLGGSGNWGQVTKLTADDATAQAEFGSSVAISEDTVVVGAPLMGDNTGSAYVFERAFGGAEKWGQVKTLRAGSDDVGEQFGNSVSVSQNTILVGAHLISGWMEIGRPPAPDDPTPDPIEVELDNAGAAYFFERNSADFATWERVKKVTAANTQAGDQFGFAVAIRGDRAVIGSLFAGNDRVGSAYVRDRNRGGRHEWGQLEKLLASEPERWDGFAFGVSIGADTVAVGAPENDGVCPDDRDCDSGSVHIYTVTQTRDQQACINTMNASLSKVWSAHARAFERCVKIYAKTGASAEACGIAPNSTIARTEERTFRQEKRKCGEPPPDFGKTDGATVNSAAMQLEAEVMREVFGDDLDGSLATSAADSDAVRCQRAVIKSINQCQRSKLKTFNRCKKKGLGSAIFRETADLESCIGDDPRGVAARACDAVSGKLATRVLPRNCLSRSVDLSSAFPGCGMGDPTDLANCVEEVVECRVCNALNQADDLAVDCDLLDDGLENASCL